MNETQPKINRYLPLITYFTFFCLSAFYFVLFADYIFFYQEKSTLFEVSFSYLTSHLKQPGSFLIWLTELQTTFYYYPIVGSLIVSIEICLIVFIISKTGEILTGRKIFLLPIIIGAVLFYLQTNYQYIGFNNLGILLQILVFYLTVRFLKERRIWIPVLLFPIWYFLTGSFSLIFLVLITIHLLVAGVKENWIKLAVLYLLVFLFFFIAKEYLFFQTIETLIFYPFDRKYAGGQITLFVSVILIISLLPLIFRFHLKFFERIKIRKFQFIQIAPFFIIGILVFPCIQRIDRKNIHYFHSEKLFYGHKFDELIEFNKQSPSVNILTNFLNNIALAETGKLNDELFQFPQSQDGSTLFLKWELAGEVLKRGGYFYYSLGMINEAQRWAYEYMVMRGNTPEGLKMLIKTELINSNYKVASKYISILKKSVYYRREAKNFERFLFNDDAVEKDSELGRKRRLKTKQDFFVLAENPAVNIDLIIASDSTNKIAVEYKFASLLLQKDFKKVTELLPMLKKAGFEMIPKNIEESVVAYSLLNLGKYPEFEEFDINPQTVIRFNEYYKIFQQNIGNKQKAMAALQDFSDTYWYYVFFG
jgi:hypothetical protein